MEPQYLYQLPEKTRQLFERMNDLARGDSQYVTVLSGYVAVPSDIPTASVDDPDDYFQSSVLLGVQERLNKIFRFVNLDLDACEAYARKFWRQRYFTVYPDMTFSLSPRTDFFGINDHFSANDVTFLDANARSLINDARVLATYLGGHA